MNKLPFACKTIGKQIDGVCSGQDSKAKSRPASKTILFKLLPHKINTLSRMY